MHFSDGIIEEYSDDEPDTSAQVTRKLNPVILKTLYLIFYHF